MFSKVRKLIPNFLVNYLWHLPKAILANLIYHFPSKGLKVIGVTGTSGKTTTSHLIYHLLSQNHFKVALISTLSAKMGGKEIDIGLHVTNPDPFTLQKLIKEIRFKGFKYLVLEVTSHGLAQFRTWGIKFDYGVLTNLAHEHLDYHGSLKNYHQEKLKLIKNSKVVVLNSQDKNFQKAKKAAKGRLITFSSSQSLARSKNLIGDFNLLNIAAAIAVAKDLGVKEKDYTKAIQSFSGIPGRMEIVQTKPFTIIIDFAHKPDALEKALKSVQKLKGAQGRIISVFGCAGLRDVQKRTLMGKISGKLSDITILTAEDPRTETVKDINDSIEKGFNLARSQGKLYREPNRQKAINLAIKLAKPGDFVCLFGKSHEKSMCFGTIEYPWSEHRAVKIALKQRSLK